MYIEFTFLDPRAIGQWDMSRKSETLTAVWSMDVDEAGPDGLGGRPPPNDDGTPHETLADQAVRLRQCFSLLESQFSGDTILLVFPDGTGPALLSAMIAGIPFDRVHELEFSPGEVRLNVTLQSTQELWQTKQGNATYEKLIDEGRQKLTELRQGGNVINIKDMMIEEERLAIEREYQEKERKRLEQEIADEAIRRERQLAMQRESQKGMSTGSTPTGLLLAAVGAVAVGVLVSGVTAQMEREVARDVGGDNQDTTISDANESSRVPMDALGETKDIVEPRQPGQATSLYQDAPVVPSLKREDRIERAQKAMEDYMNEDDGASDWLKSIADILEDPEASTHNDE